MRWTRRTFLTGSTALAAYGAGGMALNAQSNPEELPVEPLLYSLVSQDPAQVLGALQLILARGGTDLVSSLIFASRFGIRNGFDEALTKLTGENRTGWFDWMLW